MGPVETLTRATAENFDVQAYLLANPDLSVWTAGAREHFEIFGQKEGRLQINKDVLSKDSEYRRSKYERFKTYITAPHASDGFPLTISGSHFKLSDYQSESANNEFEPFANAILQNPDKLYLDLGCGLRRRLHRNCLYLEVYPSVAADIIVPPTCEYPLADAAFDGIGCLAVLEHTRKPWLVVQEIHRMLKPGGRIWIDWPFLQPIHGYPSHYFNATREGLHTIFEDAGFRVEQISTWPHQGPDFTLCWLLSVLLQNLPPQAASELKSLTVGELLNHHPNGEYWRNLLSLIDDKTRSTLACGNSMIAVKT